MVRKIRAPRCRIRILPVCRLRRHHDLRAALREIAARQFRHVFPRLRRRAGAEPATLGEAVRPFRRDGRHPACPRGHGRRFDRLKPFHGIVGIIVSAVLYGIGFGSAQPAFQAATIRLARQDRLGGANASLTAANDLSIGLGAIALGWISQYASYQALFAVSAGSVTVSLILFMFFVNRLLRKTKEPALQ